jgi:hypothetical protein
MMMAPAEAPGGLEICSSCRAELSPFPRPRLVRTHPHVDYVPFRKTLTNHPSQEEANVNCKHGYYCGGYYSEVHEIELSYDVRLAWSYQLQATTFSASM